MEARTDFDGPALELDFPGLRIGVAEYEEGPTGCTVFHFASGATIERDVRGGSPGTFGEFEWVDAVCFAGGSLYGLEAATGVAAELFRQRNYDTGWMSIAAVAGAIIFDWGPRDNAVYPDKELGRAALRTAREGRFPLGRRGAGRSATVGKTFGLEQGEPGGQGGAFRTIGPTRLAVFVVVNAVGAVVDRDGHVVRGHFDRSSGARRALVEGVEVGRQVHASMARAIHPFHALTDGDVLYAATTNEVDNEALDSVALAVVASELAWDAVLAAVS
ncbi:MAG: peptidase S58, DmpA [Actinobacteria bacterium]|nr:MAG: peptidase S58, DmpA [Actinomycetota bacterium]